MKCQQLEEEGELNPMADVFRILERFTISGRGTVYVLEKCFCKNIRLNDILYDLHGNRFRVKGVEMLHRISADVNLEDMSLGIMLEPLDGVEVEGNMLVRNLDDINFLFCNHPLYPQNVDENYKEEYQAAGLEHSCALFSYEDMQLGELSLYGEDISGLTIYRGWTMEPDMYRDFYNRLEEKGIILVNSSDEYENYQMLHEKLKQTGFHEKSKKPLCQGYRVFIYAGKILIIDNYWNKSNQEENISDKEKKLIKSFAKEVKSNFVTMDLARCNDGTIIIVELGDGQVAGFYQIKAEEFYKAIRGKNSTQIETPFPKNVTVFLRDPMPGKNIDEMKQEIADIKTAQELVDAYVNIHNKFWFIEDDFYDYDEGTEKYEIAYKNVAAWGDMMQELDKRVMEAADQEGLLAEKQPNHGTIRQLKAFMDKYGYRDSCGWWIKKKR